MLKLNISQEEQLSFETQIEGIHYDQIISHLKIVINEIEYGLPAKVGRELITVDIPPLNKIVGSKINEGDEAKVVLEIIADGRYLTPWHDTVTFISPVIVEAKIKTTKVSPDISLKTKLVMKEDKSTELKEEIKPEKEDEFKQDIKEETQDLEKILNKTIDTFNLSETEKPKEVTIEEFKRNLTKDDVLKIMERKGTKNKQIQEIIYEQAQKISTKNEPASILKEVFKILKK